VPSRRPAAGEAQHAHPAGQRPTGETPRKNPRIAKADALLAEMEHRLRSWPVAGIVWLLLIGLLVGLLAASGG
jgi:hypothetical protein